MSERLGLSATDAVTLRPLLQCNSRHAAILARTPTMRKLINNSSRDRVIDDFVREMSAESIMTEPTAVEAVELEQRVPGMHSVESYMEEPAAIHAV